MKRIALGSLVIALVSGGLAWAAAGSPIEALVNAEGSSPCQDGWAGCIVVATATSCEDASAGALCKLSASSPTSPHSKTSDMLKALPNSRRIPSAS